MTDKRSYFPLTTASQRRLLFETWEATHDGALASQRAHVARRTFFYWKARFITGGYAALDHVASRALTHPPRVAADVEQQVIALHQQHREWCKQRLAGELAKAQGWVPLVSPTTAKQAKAGDCEERCAPSYRASGAACRRAERLAQWRHKPIAYTQHAPSVVQPPVASSNT